MANKPSEQELAQMVEGFTYDLATGLLTWRHRPRSHFNSNAGYARWNGHYPGHIAGRIDGKGYQSIKFGWQEYLAHHIIWFLQRGAWPTEIDHIDGDPQNNRIDNLRVVTRLENSHNRRISRRNTSGFTGVVRSGNRWTAQISVAGEHFYLGSFKTMDEAVAARVAANRKHGFHENHGSPRRSLSTKESR